MTIARTCFKEMDSWFDSSFDESVNVAKDHVWTLLRQEMAAVWDNVASTSLATSLIIVSTLSPYPFTPPSAITGTLTLCPVSNPAKGSVCSMLVKAAR